MEAGAVHGASTIDQVMRLVDEHPDPPRVRQRQAVEHRGAVEVVVVVTDDHVAPSRHLLAKVVRADRMGQSDLAQSLTGQGPRRHGRRSSSRQPVVEAVGKRA